MKMTAELHRANEPVALQEITVTPDGDHRCGAALTFLTRSFEATGPDGVWTASAVPARPLSILAWRNASIESGGYDAAAYTVAYPWPAVVEIDTVD